MHSQSNQKRLCKTSKNSEVILLEEEEVAQQFELLIDSLMEKILNTMSYQIFAFLAIIQ